MSVKKHNVRRKKITVNRWVFRIKITKRLQYRNTLIRLLFTRVTQKKKNRKSDDEMDYSKVILFFRLFSTNDFFLCLGSPLLRLFYLLTRKGTYAFHNFVTVGQEKKIFFFFFFGFINVYKKRQLKKSTLYSFSVRTRFFRFIYRQITSSTTVFHAPIKKKLTEQLPKKQQKRDFVKNSLDSKRFNF